MKLISTLILLVFYQAFCSRNILAINQTKVIESFRVKSSILYRLATTQVESTIRNTAGHTQELTFYVTFPSQAFVTGFSMQIDGKVYTGEVKEKKSTRKHHGVDFTAGDRAGYIQRVPRFTIIFEVSVNVASGSAAKFTLTYQEVLIRKFGLYEHEIHMNLGQLVADFLVDIFIQENKALRNLTTPTLRIGSLSTNTVEVDDWMISVSRPSAETAHITYRPSLDDQRHYGTSNSFAVQYDVERNPNGEIVIIEGYFIHFFAPDLLSMAKDIVFILDESGSMFGQKIEQMKDAMLKILDDLQPEDRFNILVFSSNVRSWQRQLVTATRSTILEAKRFIGTIVADGGTNIYDALTKGIKELKSREDSRRVAIIFFLTDGQATVGVESSYVIETMVQRYNANTSSIICLAFGKDADMDLLTKISAQNSGIVKQIYEASDVVEQVSSIYDQISEVSVKNISINYLPGSVDQSTVTNNNFPVIYKGSEVVITGKLAANATDFQAEVTGLQKSGGLDLSVKAHVNELKPHTNESFNTYVIIPHDSTGMVEKMWAYLTIKEVLNEKEKHSYNPEKIKELDNKILQTSLKYKFVTPATSMVITKPESPEKPDQAVKTAQTTPKVVEKAELDYYVPPVQSQVHIPTIVFSARTRPTTTPTTPSTTTVAPSGFLLSVIMAETKDLLVCIAPKNITDGKYNLIQSANGAGVDIHTACAGKNCKKIFIESVILKSIGKSTVISVDDGGDWVYEEITGFTVKKMTPDMIIISFNDIEVIVRWFTKKGGKHYILGIKVNSLKGYKGLLGKLLKRSAQQMKKRKKTKVPPLCRDKASDIATVLKYKMAAQFMV